MKNRLLVSGSFRDPDGFLFSRNGNIFRQINISYKDNYDLLMSSGLYKDLVKNELIVSHEEVDPDIASTKNVYRIIKPHLIPFVSYPYEWCFSQIKDAALATLEIQKKSVKYGMSLKDASAYNIQFDNGKPIFIDTLSFEKYQEGKPWVAYRQFCQHFLAPLTLMSYTDVRLSQLLRIYIDGIPLDLTRRLLPVKTRLMLPLLAHIHIHSKSQRKYENRQINIKKHGNISKFALMGLIESLEASIRRLKCNIRNTEWAEYYKHTNYSSESFKIKTDLVKSYLNIIKPSNVWDIGSNIGVFSRISANMGIKTISFDLDPSAVEQNCRHVKESKEKNILPILLDVANPSPGLGWENRERMSIFQRTPADTVFALALIHHLAISNNLPLAKIASFFSSICKNLIIEFVPKKDSQVKKLLVSREDIFFDYSKEIFEKEFKKYFSIVKSQDIQNTERTIYLMKRLLSS